MPVTAAGNEVSAVAADSCKQEWHLDGRSDSRGVTVQSVVEWMRMEKRMARNVSQPVCGAELAKAADLPVYVLSSRMNKLFAHVSVSCERLVCCTG